MTDDGYTLHVDTLHAACDERRRRLEARIRELERALWEAADRLRRNGAYIDASRYRAIAEDSCE